MLTEDTSAKSPDEIIEPKSGPNDAIEGLPSIGGHQVEPKEWRGFYAYMLKGGTNDSAAVAAGVTPYTIIKWRKQPWWHQMFEDHYRAANDKLVSDLIKHDPDVVKAYGEIIKGERADDKSVMAQTKVIGARMEIGKAPIVDKRAVQVNNTQTINNSGTINIAQLKTLSSKELLEYNDTGILPERVLADE